MSESKELYLTVNYIKNKVDMLEKIEILNLRANEVLHDKYISLLQNDPLLMSVYKAIDGVKSQTEIASDISTSDKTVSVKIKTLFENGLIEIKSIGSSGKRIYTHSVAEQAFQLTKI